MAENLNPEEAKARAIAAMGNPLGAHYYALWQELALLYSKWGEYVVLFGTKPSRIDLLNRAAPAFFRMVQDGLWEEILLGIARITDTPKSRNRTNLTISSLPLEISGGEFKAQVEQVVRVALDATQFCRDARNRRIAHRDLALSLGQGSVPLQLANRQLVAKAFSIVE